MCYELIETVVAAQVSLHIQVRWDPSAEKGLKAVKNMISVTKKLSASDIYLQSKN